MKDRFVLWVAMSITCLVIFSVTIFSVIYYISRSPYVHHITSIDANTYELCPGDVIEYNTIITIREIGYVVYTYTQFLDVETRLPIVSIAGFNIPEIEPRIVLVASENQLVKDFPLTLYYPVPDYLTKPGKYQMMRVARIDGRYSQYYIVNFAIKENCAD